MSQEGLHYVTNYVEVYPPKEIPIRNRAGTSSSALTRPSHVSERRVLPEPKALFQIIYI